MAATYDDKYLCAECGAINPLHRNYCTRKEVVSVNGGGSGSNGDGTMGFGSGILI